MAPPNINTVLPDLYYMLKTRTLLTDTARSLEIVPRGGPPLKMGGSASTIHNHKAPKGGPPLEFINIQPKKGGPPLEFINQRGVRL